MKRLPTFLSVAAMALLLSSCMRQPDTEGFKKTISDLHQVSTESMMSGETTKVIAFYAEDAISMPPNMEPLKGKQAIEQWMKQMSVAGLKVTKAQFETMGEGVGGTIAYEYGTYEMTMDIPQMGVQDDAGNYVSLWEQQQDGSWKIIAETWNSTKPMPEMTMP